MVSDASVGLQIKKKRQEAGLSLRELARRTDLTAAFLSQLERGQTNASLDSLRRIAEALQVSILYFLSGANESRRRRSRARGNSPVTRCSERLNLDLPASGVAYELLTPTLSQTLEAICGRLAPGAGNVARRLRAPTEEFIYVLSGALAVGLEKERYILHPGDTIYFEGAQLVELSNASDTEETVWISVITPPVF